MGEPGAEPGDASHQRKDLASPPERVQALKKEFWGTPLGRGYFVASSGNVTDAILAKYIESQGVEPQDDDDFRISG